MKLPKKPGVYKITNIINNKIYVGQTVNIYLRWIEHLCSLRNNYKENIYLQNSFNKHGEHNFKCEILELCDKNNLRIREHYWVAFLQALNRKIGYNIAPTNEDGSYSHSEETLRKIKDGRSRVPHEILYSKERNEKIRKSKMNISRDEETKIKLSQYWKTKYQEGLVVNPMQGKKHSEETKDKIRKKALERKNRSYKKLLVIDEYGNEILRIGLKEGLDLFGVNHTRHLIRTKKKSKDGKSFKVI